MGLAGSTAVAQPRVERPYWTLSLYPDAGEAGGCLIAPRVGAVGGLVVPDPDRSEAEADRRARGQIRRYCAANRLNRFITLTYAGEGCHNERAFRAHIAEAFKDLRRRLGGEPLPYLWVPEWHPGGHGLHGHAAVGRYVPRSKLVESWPHGYVSIKLIGDLPVGSGALEEARRCAGYLAKYVGKAIGERRAPGLHRYEVAQGFQPQVVKLEGRSVDAVIRQASDVMGGAPSEVWRSDDQEGWDGPPICSVRWNG